ncbi:winged helix DNA-binding domain-containing protein [Candidatus Bathyarchaeota archaeon]|nr:MAG: winged helix DNA-binding domain-containing protein [Candidatus Bathyarchaeota archaeon]
MGINLSRAQVNSWRLSRHHLAKRARKGQIENVVSDLCGVQAQVLSYAALAIWARVEGITIQDVQDALWKRRSVVKTWCMRGTLHLISASDLPVYVAARKTTLVVKRDWLSPEIGVEERERIVHAIREALDGQILTREQLADEVVERLSVSASVRKHMLSGWGNLLGPAAEHGYLCFGPSQGTKVTFVRPDQWIGGWDEPTGRDAWKILLRRFLSNYGPANHHDIAHWWGLRPERARMLMEYIADELVEVEFEGKRWARGVDVERIVHVERVRSVKLLPSWDCYVMFYHPRELFVSQNDRARVFRKLEGNAPVLLINGVAGGVWEQRRKGSHIELRVHPFSHLDSRHKQLVREEAASLGEFLGTNVDVTILS